MITARNGGAADPVVVCEDLRQQVEPPLSARVAEWFERRDWLRDNDLVIVPKSCILCATDLIELYFTRGVYAVFPINYVYDFSSNSGIVPVGP